MSFNRLFWSSVVIGILGGIVMLVTNIMQMHGFVATEAGLTFVSFIAWSCYFFSGATPGNAIISWLSFIVGIVCAIFIFLLTDVMAGMGLDVMHLALPIAVMIGIVPMCLAERLPFGNRVPSVYLGAATYFGMMGIPAVAANGFLMVAVAELVYAVIGLFAGFLTIKISGLFLPAAASPGAAGQTGDEAVPVKSLSE